jgi:hypothetical protein
LEPDGLICSPGAGRLASNDVPAAKSPAVSRERETSVHFFFETFLVFFAVFFAAVFAVFFTAFFAFFAFLAMLPSDELASSLRAFGNRDALLLEYTNAPKKTASGLKKC